MTSQQPESNSPASLQPLSDIHRARNRQTRGGWEDYADHRRRVTRVICDAAAQEAATHDATIPRDGVSLGVLGAGNCNDVDLHDLLERFARIDLVDLDDESLVEAVAREGLADDRRVALRGGVDLTGIMRQLDEGVASRVAPNVEDCLRAATTSDPLAGDVWDVVVSPCVLTQMIDSLVGAFGTNSPAMLRLMDAVRLRHLRLLVESTRPGGAALLFTDVVASHTAPELANWSDGELAARLDEVIAARNFFTGVNPHVLATLLSTNAHLAPRIAAVRPLAPWRWRIGPTVRLVCGFVIQRK